MEKGTQQENMMTQQYKQCLRRSQTNGGKRRKEIGTTKLPTNERI